MTGRANDIQGYVHGCSRILCERCAARIEQPTAQLRPMFGRVIHSQDVRCDACGAIVVYRCDREFSALSLDEFRRLVGLGSGGSRFETGIGCLSDAEWRALRRLERMGLTRTFDHDSTRVGIERTRIGEWYAA